MSCSQLDSSATCGRTNAPHDHSVGGNLRHGKNGLLEYTAGRDLSIFRSTCLFDVRDTSVEQDGYCNRENELFMVFEDTKVFLANRGMQHWGDRSEIIRAEVHDVQMSMNVFGRVYLTNMLVQVGFSFITRKVESSAD